jgi:hypothetical protein
MIKLFLSGRTSSIDEAFYHYYLDGMLEEVFLGNDEVYNYLGSNKIDLSGLNAGVYQVILQNGKQEIEGIQRIIISKD